MQEFKFWLNLKLWQKLLFLIPGICLAIFFLATTCYLLWEEKYAQKVYPGVKIEEKDFGGETPEEIENYFQQKNSQISLDFTFIYKDQIATLSAQEIAWGYDEKMISSQALSLGRSGNLLSDLYQKIISLKSGSSLSPSYAYDRQKLIPFLKKMAAQIDYPPQEALFRFSYGKVTAFRPSASGQAVDIEATQKLMNETLSLLKKGGALPPFLKIDLVIQPVEPKVTTTEANNLGIQGLVSQGSSRFLGSIANRIHNIQLAVSRLNGILVAPGEEFSFNKALGDVSKFTGYKEAYIIQEGRTILGDGGGVCQVSTTLFRALLNAGLPITERHAHSYRVGYYERGSLPGFDASVYDPRWDLKFTNDTGQHLLIQSAINFKAAALTFELYGAPDGRKVTISKPLIKNQTPPPEDLYQDDPTLPKGQVKQVDWKAEGADVSFSRKVEREDKVLINETYSSHYQPWQAVYLRGTKE